MSTPPPPKSEGKAASKHPNGNSVRNRSAELSIPGCEKEILAVTDFTCATPFESFCNKIEVAVREWAQLWATSPSWFERKHSAQLWRRFLPLGTSSCVLALYIPARDLAKIQLPVDRMVRNGALILSYSPLRTVSLREQAFLWNVLELVSRSLFAPADEAELLSHDEGSAERLAGFLTTFPFIVPNPSSGLMLALQYVARDAPMLGYREDNGRDHRTCGRHRREDGCRLNEAFLCTPESPSSENKEDGPHDDDSEEVPVSRIPSQGAFTPACHFTGLVHASRGCWRHDDTSSCLQTCDRAAFEAQCFANFSDPVMIAHGMGYGRTFSHLMRQTPDGSACEILRFRKYHPKIILHCREHCSSEQEVVEEKTCSCDTWALHPLCLPFLYADRFRGFSTVTSATENAPYRWRVHGSRRAYQPSHCHHQVDILVAAALRKDQNFKSGCAHDPPITWNDMYSAMRLDGSAGAVLGASQGYGRFQFAMICCPPPRLPHVDRFESFEKEKRSTCHQTAYRQFCLFHGWKWDGLLPEQVTKNTLPDQPPSEGEQKIIENEERPAFRMCTSEALSLLTHSQIFNNPVERGITSGILASLVSGETGESRLRTDSGFITALLVEPSANGDVTVWTSTAAGWRQHLVQEQSTDSDAMDPCVQAVTVLAGRHPTRVSYVIAPNDEKETQVQNVANSYVPSCPPSYPHPCCHVPPVAAFEAIFPPEYVKVRARLMQEMVRKFVTVVDTHRQERILSMQQDDGQQESNGDDSGDEVSNDSFQCACASQHKSLSTSHVNFCNDYCVNFSRTSVSKDSQFFQMLSDKNSTDFGMFRAKLGSFSRQMFWNLNELECLSTLHRTLGSNVTNENVASGSFLASESGRSESHFASLSQLWLEMLEAGEGHCGEQVSCPQFYSNFLRPRCANGANFLLKIGPRLDPLMMIEVNSHVTAPTSASKSTSKDVLQSVLHQIRNASMTGAVGIDSAELEWKVSCRRMQPGIDANLSSALHMVWKLAHFTVRIAVEERKMELRRLKQLEEERIKAIELRSETDGDKHDADAEEIESSEESKLKSKPKQISSVWSSLASIGSIEAVQSLNLSKKGKVLLGTLASDDGTSSGSGPLSISTSGKPESKVQASNDELQYGRAFGGISQAIWDDLFAYMLEKPATPPVASKAYTGINYLFVSRLDRNLQKIAVVPTGGLLYRFSVCVLALHQLRDRRTKPGLTLSKMFALWKGLTTQISSFWKKKKMMPFRFLLGDSGQSLVDGLRKSDDLPLSVIKRVCTPIYKCNLLHQKLQQLQLCLYLSTRSNAAPNEVELARHRSSPALSDSSADDSFESDSDFEDGMSPISPETVKQDQSNSKLYYPCGVVKAHPTIHILAPQVCAGCQRSLSNPKETVERKGEALPLYVPLCQPQFLPTSDRILEQKRTLLSIKDQRDRMIYMSRQLQADMSAFKAANTGIPWDAERAGELCDNFSGTPYPGSLIDFVRWYSPKDVEEIKCDRVCTNASCLQSENAVCLVDAKKPSKGHHHTHFELSQRFQEQGNLWQLLWEDDELTGAAYWDVNSRPCKDHHQRLQEPLFNAQSEGERIIWELESMQLPFLTAQLSGVSTWVFLQQLARMCWPMGPCSVHRVAGGESKVSHHAGLSTLSQLWDFGVSKLHGSIAPVSLFSMFVGDPCGLAHENVREGGFSLRRSHSRDDKSLPSNGESEMESLQSTLGTLEELDKSLPQLSLFNVLQYLEWEACKALSVCNLLSPELLIMSAKAQSCSQDELQALSKRGLLVDDISGYRDACYSLLDALLSQTCEVQEFSDDTQDGSSDGGFTFGEDGIIPASPENKRGPSIVSSVPPPAAPRFETSGFVTIPRNVILTQSAARTVFWPSAEHSIFQHHQSACEMGLECTSSCVHRGAGPNCAADTEVRLILQMCGLDVGGVPAIGPVLPWRDCAGGRVRVYAMSTSGSVCGLLTPVLCSSAEVGMESNVCADNGKWAGGRIAMRLGLAGHYLWYSLPEQVTQASLIPQ